MGDNNGTDQGFEGALYQRAQDIYNAENQLVKALPKMAKAASSGELRQGLQDHLEQCEINATPKASQPPLSHPGATPDSNRAKRPPLSEPAITNQQLEPGDRVEGLGDFGKPTGEIGTVEQSNEDDAVVKWDGDGRKRSHQASLKKISRSSHPPA